MKKVPTTHCLLRVPTSIVLSTLVLFSVQSALSDQFPSRISVSTQAGSYSHGVGNPIANAGSLKRVARGRFAGVKNYSKYQAPSPNQLNSQGYPRVKPSVPFIREEIHHKRPAPAWQYNTYESEIPVLPPSPYKVDSPDPESLWPEGLFLPPSHHSPQKFKTHQAKSRDPFLLEGTQAVAAVNKAQEHGELFFDHIPHIESLIFNQGIRERNHLEPYRIGSIRSSWPYSRP